MVFDHRRDAGIAEHGRAEIAEPVAAAVQRLHQIERRPQRAAGEARASSGRPSRRASSAVASGPWPACSNRSSRTQAKQDLRIDEPGTEIEQCARPAMRDAARQRKARPPSAGTPDLRAAGCETRPSDPPERSSMRAEGVATVRHALSSRDEASAKARLASRSSGRDARQFLGQELQRLRVHLDAQIRRAGQFGIESTASVTRRFRCIDRALDAELVHRVRAAEHRVAADRLADLVGSPATSRRSSATW